MLGRTAALVAVLTAAGCSRDLAIPAQNRIGVLPSAFESVAPREAVQFRAAGGAGGYRFTWAPGGQLSGDDAALDPGGLYTAGSRGSAKDVIEVIDATGATATATVSVSAAVAIAPALAGVVPGGAIRFTATGGKPPYLFVLEQGPSGAHLDPGGAYTAGSTGSTADVIAVHDATGDPAAAARATVQIGGQLTLFRAETRAVAPHESVALVAIGGKPPYRFDLQTAGSGALLDPSDAPTINAITGVYLAGNRLGDPSATTAYDVLKVTDSADAPQTATLAVPVGPRLTLSLDATAVFPGQVAHLSAAGGRPPYRFAFVPWSAAAARDPWRTLGGNGGNRSHGSVDAVTGDYVPGNSPGAVDVLQVTDSTGAPAVLLTAPTVGGTPLAIGFGTARCVSGDFNGDGSQDVAFLGYSNRIARVITAEGLAGAAPAVQPYWPTRTPLAATAVGDFTGAGRDQIVFFGGDHDSSPSTPWASYDLWAAVPDAAGFLSFQQIAGGGAAPGYVDVLNDAANQPWAGAGYTHRVATNYAIGTGAAVLDPSGAGTWHLYTDGYDPTTLPTANGATGTPRCPTLSATDSVLLRFDWPVGAPAPASPPTCLHVTSYCPSCSGAARPMPRVLAFLAGDFNGDGRTDLAWIPGTTDRLASGASARIYVAYGSGGRVAPGESTTFGAPVSDWPDGGWSFEANGDNSPSQNVAQVVRLATGLDAIVLRMVDGTGRAKLVMARPRPSGRWNFGPEHVVDPFPGDGAVSGFAVYTPTPGSPSSLAAWSTSSSAFAGVGIDPAYAPTFAFTAPAALATLPFAVDAGCMPDVNGDGLADLVAAGNFAGVAQVVTGEAAFSGARVGSFGTRAHLRGLKFPIAGGDLDGDGYGDLVVPNEQNGVSVLWGGGGMFAWGPQVLAAPVSALAVGDFFGDGRPSVLYQERSGRFGRIRNRGDGTFDPAQALTGVAAAGGAPLVNLLLYPAGLGTGAPGLDAIGFAPNVKELHALLLWPDRVVDVASRPFPKLSNDFNDLWDCWASAAGDDQPIVVAGCAFGQGGGAGSAIAIFGASISNPDGTGGMPALSDWVALTPTTAGSEYVRATTAPNGARVAALGLQRVPGSGARPDTAVFLFGTDELYAVEVRSGGSLDPRTWSVSAPYLVSPSAAGSAPFLAVAGTMDSAAGTYFHAIGGGDGKLTHVKRTADGYELVERFESPAYPLGVILPVSNSAPGVRSPGDAAIFFGDLFGTGVNSEVIPFLNDGTGKLR